MSQSPDYSNKGFATRAIHHAYDPQNEHGALTPPLHFTSTFAFRCRRRRTFGGLKNQTFNCPIKLGHIKTIATAAIQRCQKSVLAVFRFGIAQRKKRLALPTPHQNYCHSRKMRRCLDW